MFLFVFVADFRPNFACLCQSFKMMVHIVIFDTLNLCWETYKDWTERWTEGCHCFIVSVIRYHQIILVLSNFFSKQLHKGGKPPPLSSKHTCYQRWATLKHPSGSQAKEKHDFGALRLSVLLWYTIHYSAALFSQKWMSVGSVSPFLCEKNPKV